MLILLGILLFIVTLVYDLYTDLKLWKEDKPIDHIRGSILRAIGLIPAILLIGWPSFLFVLALYWLLFDGLFNLKRNFGWWFTGSDDEDDAKTDDLLQKLKVNQQKALKFGLILIGLLLYIGLR